MRKSLLISTLFVFCTLLSQNALASSDMGWKSLGVGVGYVDPDNVDGTLGFGAFADLGTFATNWHLEPQIGYWSKSQGAFGYDATIRDLSFGSRANYMFPVSSRKFQPYAGAGLGLHFVTAKVSTPAQDMGTFIIPAMTASDTSTKLGLDMGGGFVTPLSAKTDLTGDLWYTAVSDVGHFSLKLGVAMKLGK
ncbi:MAG TPA: hypothetical protein VF363_01730 [Candidatus Eisenbacteria bacterium]